MTLQSDWNLKLTCNFTRLHHWLKASTIFNAKKSWMKPREPRLQCHTLIQEGWISMFDLGVAIVIDVYTPNFMTLPDFLLASHLTTQSHQLKMCLAVPRAEYGAVPEMKCEVAVLYQSTPFQTKKLKAQNPWDMLHIFIMFLKSYSKIFGKYS